MKIIRTVLAVIFLVGVTLLFLDVTGALHKWLGWMAKVQFLPAVLALNVGVILALVLLTLIFGRVYCSVICPLGVTQDVVSHIRVRRDRRKRRVKHFSFIKEQKLLRYILWGIYVIAIIFGLNVVVSLLAPYSAYGRIAQTLFGPVYGWTNNLLAIFSEHAGGYAFYSKEVWLRGLPTLIVSVLTVVAIVAMAWRGGRDYCNEICPVGTTLSFFSRFAMFRIKIDTDKCHNCRVCEYNCKAKCIDSKNHKIDYSRCVDCFDCLPKCNSDALSYTFAWKGATRKVGPEAVEPAPAAGPVSSAQTAPAVPVEESKAETPAPANDSKAPDASRRAFLAASAMVAGAAALKAEDKAIDGGLAEILDKKAPLRNHIVTPPGSISEKNMHRHCTACQLCVANCPNGVLRPSSDLEHFMQPHSSFERGYCRPECTTCGQVCPTGAIRRIDRAEKSSIQTGHAVWIRENCLPLTQGVSCGNCARHCPVGAIIMVPSAPEDESSVLIPAVDESRCIGCGACENLCPSRPYSAIYVEGHPVHKTV